MKKISLLSFILIFIAIYNASAYYNLATRQDEFILISDTKEVSMGKSIAKNVEKEYKPVGDMLVQKRVAEIGNRVASYCDRKVIAYHFKVLDKKIVNAFSLPGGYVYIFKGLLDKMKSDDELAAVLAHEIAHIAARHGIKKMQSSLGYNALLILSMGVDATPETRVMTGEALGQLMLSYSREDEILADRLAVKYMRAAGYNPKGMVDFLHTLQDIDRKGPIRQKMYYRSHPYVAERIAIVKEEMGTRDFSDYLNAPQPEPR